jgi:hypothetical protein
VHLIIVLPYTPTLPVTVAKRSKAWTVFARSEAGSWVRISHKAWMFGMCVYSVFVLSCI